MILVSMKSNWAKLVVVNFIHIEWNQIVIFDENLTSLFDI